LLNAVVTKLKGVNTTTEITKSSPKSNPKHF
jgi:hypothetical protein